MSRPLPPERFEAVLQSISDGVITVDSKWRITCFNNAAQRILGIPRIKALGRRCYEVLKADVCKGACPLQYTIEKGIPVAGLVVHFTNSEGLKVPVSISTALFRNKEGKVIGGVETFRDLREVEWFRKEIDKNYTFDDIVSKSPKIKKILSLLPTIAASDSTVLITGESGTGKELFARAIHNHSPRSGKPFVAVNCGGFPDTLIESELFGYEAGAFTGASKAKPGRFALAEGGTLFLDEIGELPPLLQVKLLRVLQDKSYEPLGSVKTVKADVRIIAATNRDLEAMVKEGKFREDLFYRINVIRMALPPLRDRREDLPLLINHFVSRFSALQGKTINGVSEEALRLLLAYDYPGNVRELENIIEHGCVLCPGGLIQVHHLPEWMGKERGDSKIAEGLQETEKQLILSALRRNNWNRLATARDLGIHKTTLFRKIKKLQISLPKTDGRYKKDRVADLRELQ